LPCNFMPGSGKIHASKSFRIHTIQMNPF